MKLHYINAWPCVAIGFIVAIQLPAIRGFQIYRDNTRSVSLRLSPSSSWSRTRSLLWMAVGNVTSTSPSQSSSVTIDEATGSKEEKVESPSTIPLSGSKTERYREVVIEEYEEYSRCLSPREERKEVELEFDNIENDDALWLKPLRKAARRVRNAIGAAKRATHLNPRKNKKPGTLILLRCVSSTYNENHQFTGWLDPPLSDQGKEQCGHIGRILVAEGFDNVDVVYTSRLQRSISTAWNVLETMDSLFIPVYKTFRLNQRMYGALEGLSKEETMLEFGPKVVHAWRNSLKARPPPLSKDDFAHPRYDRRYVDVPLDSIPDTESLLECQDRARLLWEYQIQNDIEKGKTVLVVAHRDSIRGLCKVIDNITNEEDISRIDVPRGVPILYRFDNAMNPMTPDHKKEKETGSLSTAFVTNGTFLEKPENLELALRKHDQWYNARSFMIGSNRTQTSASIDPSDDRSNRRVATLSKSLVKLRDTDPSIVSNEIGSNGHEHGSGVAERWSDDPCEFEDYDIFDEEIEEPITMPIVPLSSVIADKEPNQKLGGKAASSKQKPKDGPFVVFIRHGRTPHNNMQLFTGWEDPPLAVEGVDDAKNAGRLLRRHGFEFDVCYTSWLTRAIQTAYYALDELDQVWVPMVKSWRLNERMYGDLTGKSKKMIANEYGEDQLKKWRRGYTIRPPAVSSYSLNYPGNDERRAKHFKDLPISIRESISRSLEKRKPTIHRKFPKTESLKDCMDRSIPFYTERIRREAVDKGKRVLITSHENAIRGILMYLCDIPEEAMNQLHLPNGLPLVYDVRGRCISLLDDGSGADPNEVHDFGPAAKYLFKPCELDDEFFDEMEKKELTP